eukprot:c51953_g1_i1 orf=255-446(+)
MTVTCIQVNVWRSELVKRGLKPPSAIKVGMLQAPNVNKKQVWRIQDQACANALFSIQYGCSLV